MPDKSPLTSAMNTGTPILLKLSAMTRKRYGFTRTCRPGDQTMAIGHAWQQ